MAAGLGFKDFTTGEVLTAADVDGYLMQGIWVFASAAARDAAVTSPQEGNFAFLKDTNTTTYYTGSAWTNLDTTGMVNPMTTTGDTIYSSSGSTPARLGIGTAGQVLQVNSGATAPEWATPAAGGGMTLLNTGGTALSGGTVTISSLSTSYKHLYLVVTNARTSVNSTDINFRLNGDTATKYGQGAIRNIGGTLLGRGNPSTTSLSEILMTTSGTTDTYQAQLQLWIPNYTITGGVGIHYQHYGYTGSSLAFYTGSAVYNNSAAITSLSFIVASPDTLTAGTAYVYGVS